MRFKKSKNHRFLPVPIVVQTIIWQEDFAVIALI